MDEAVPLVRQLDRVLIEAEDPSALFRLFSEGFGLPVGWEFGDYGEVVSGSVWAGNVCLEFARFKELRFGRVAAWDEADAGRARLGGIAFEPTMPVFEVAGMLGGLGLHPGAGHTSENWTSLEVKGLLDPPGVVFLTEYAFDGAAWRAGLGEAFAASGGGPLGFEGVQEIHIGVRDVNEATPAWSGLLQGLPVYPGAAWCGAERGALRLVPWGRDEVASLMLRVRSVAAATAFLESAGMPAHESLDGVFLEPTLVQGLHLQLVDGETPAFWEFA
jgi:hypothetical protein